MDTGSQSNHIDPAFIPDLSLRNTTKISLQDPSGESIVQGGFVDTVALGSLRATNQEFLLTSLAQVRKHCPGVIGILGQEFLANFDYVLDLRRRRLLPADPPSGPRIPTGLIYGRMAVHTNFGDLILDSGAELLLLFRTSFRSPNRSIMTATGSTLLASSEASVLEIGNRLYRVPNANFAPNPGAEEAGLLPATLFQTIYVSNSGHYVVLDPKLQ